MDNMDIIIVLLMFATSIVSAILDNRRKAKKKAEDAARRQARQQGPFKPFTSVDPEMPDDDIEPKPVTEPWKPVQPKTASTIKFEEGESTIPDHGQSPIFAPEEPEKAMEEVDARKLIIYDAIMHPKFKE